MTIFGVSSGYYFIAWTGSLFLYFNMKDKKLKPLRFVYHLKNSWDETVFGKLIDIIFFTILGSFIGVVILQPINPQQCLVSGITWLSLADSISKKGVNKND